MNLYEDEIPTSNNTENESVLIEYDLSKEMTLHEMISKFKSIVKSPTTDFQIYFVCGDELKNTCYNEFLDFLQSTFGQELNGRFTFRGIFHYELIRYPMSYKCAFPESTRIKYDESRLHFILRSIKNNLIFIELFLGKYTDSYYITPLAYLPIKHLQSLQIEYEIF
jgi:hypothetical protein